MVMVQLIGCTLVVLVEDEEFFFVGLFFFRSEVGVGGVLNF